jgi:predicted RNA-binding Zn-ribbon protein involved in translation (DUF1610 family)
MIQHNGQGLPCPKCATVIPLKAEDLLFSIRFVCPNCGLAISLDRSESREALDALEEFYYAMEEIKAREPNLK